MTVTDRQPRRSPMAWRLTLAFALLLAVAPRAMAQPASIEIYGFAMCEVADERVITAWNCFDFLGMYRQLGAEISMPPTTRTAGA